MYSQTFQIRWDEVDPNQHMRHTVYLTYGAEARMAVFAENGIDFTTDGGIGIAPVLFREEAIYRREVPIERELKSAPKSRRFRMTAAGGRCATKSSAQTVSSRRRLTPMGLDRHAGAQTCCSAGGNRGPDARIGADRVVTPARDVRNLARWRAGVRAVAACD